MEWMSDRSVVKVSLAFFPLNKQKQTLNLSQVLCTGHKASPSAWFGFYCKLKSYFDFFLSICFLNATFCNVTINIEANCIHKSGNQCFFDLIEIRKPLIIGLDWALANVYFLCTTGRKKPSWTFYSFRYSNGHSSAQ